MKPVTATNVNPSANGQAVSPETPQPETPKLTLVASELAFNVLLTLPAGTVDELARQYAKKGLKLKETRGDYKDATKAAAKVYCALEIRLNAMKEQNFQPANKSLAEFIKDITGEKPPTHALTLKNAFGAYVRSSFIAETDYDANSNNCLELAARIVDAVKGDLQHDAVQKAVAELKARTDKEAKNLREILASVKPVEKMTAEEAIETFIRITEDGHLTPCIAHISDMITDMPETEQRETYLACARMLERLDTAIGEKADRWTFEASNAIAITAAGLPVGTVKPEVEPETETVPVLDNQPAGLVEA